MLRKTPSVRQLYQSLLQALRNISGTGDDLLPELTKPFFEKVLRDCEKKQSLQVIKVKLRDKQEFGRHFCSEVHAVDVTVKERAQTLSVIYSFSYKMYYEKESYEKIIFSKSLSVHHKSLSSCWQSKETSKEFVETYQLIIKSQPLSEDARFFLLPNHTFEKGIIQTKRNIHHQTLLLCH